MNEILSIAILLTEILMVLQCLQIAFRQEIHLDKYMVGIILVDVSLYMLINMGILPAACSIALYVLLFLYCYVEFGRTKVKIVLGLIVGLVLAGCIESVVAFITSRYKNENNALYILLLSSIVALGFTCFVRSKIIFSRFRKIKNRNQDLHIIAIILCISMVVLLTDYYFEHKPVNIYVICVVASMALILFYVYRLELARNEIEKKNYELELQKVYGGVYEKLIADVRQRQHDFKNQLGAIYSMHLVATSLDELVCMQNEYGNTIQYDSKFDAILTNCDNPILAGYLYHRCLSCEDNGILVDYNIHIEQAQSGFPLHELIEVLGILIDNACESVSSEQKDDMRIKLECVEDEHTIMLCVSNPSRYISYSEIEKMFVKGFSTKGENRGIGLTRVLELSKKYDSELKVSNVVYDEHNWIEFAMKIAK